MTHDSGWSKSSEFLLIGELTNLILVNGEWKGVYTPLSKCIGIFNNEKLRYEY